MKSGKRAAFSIGLCISPISTAFTDLTRTPYRTHFRPRYYSSNPTNTPTTEDQSKEPCEVVANAAGKFKILTCMSTTCSKKRESLRMDEYATFSAFYGRVKNSGLSISIEECPCLGACKDAPCVAVEHVDYIGTVSLEGMSPAEFSERVFHSVVTEDDADRVWSILNHAIQVVAKEQGESGDYVSDGLS